MVVQMLLQALLLQEELLLILSIGEQVLLLKQEQDLLQGLILPL